jgi:hypothetical protein
MQTQQPNLEILKLSDLDLGAFATRIMQRRSPASTLADFVKESIDLEAETRTPADLARLSVVWRDMAGAHIDVIQNHLLRYDCRKLSDFGATVRAAIIDAQLTTWAARLEAKFAELRALLDAANADIYRREKAENDVRGRLNIASAIVEDLRAHRPVADWRYDLMKSKVEPTDAAKCGATMQCLICGEDAVCQGPAPIDPIDRLLPACTCSKYIAGDGSWCPRHG